MIILSNLIIQIGNLDNRANNISIATDNMDFRIAKMITLINITSNLQTK